MFRPRKKNSNLKAIANIKLFFFQGKDSERTINMTLQIGVENEEPLFFCKYNPGKAPSPSTVNITIKVVATNDPPYFDKDTTNVYQKEEEPSGQVLFTPKVTDPDSDLDKIRSVSCKCVQW